MIPFRAALVLWLAAAGSGGAQPKVDSFEWEPACNGAVVEVTQDQGRVLKIAAEALHSRSGRSWEIDFRGGGLPAVTYKESIAKFHAEGDQAGELIGYELVKYRFWASDNLHFTPSDARLFGDLKELLESVLAYLKR